MKDKAQIKIKGEKKPRRGKSFLWSQFDPFRTDRRSKVGKLVEGLKQGLVSDVGGSPDNRQWVLIRRIVSMYLRLMQFDNAFIRLKGEVTQAALAQSIALENALRRDLSALGVDEKGKKRRPTFDLNAYLESRYPQKEEERPS
jgi:hypothetical protein